MKSKKLMERDGERLVFGNIILANDSRCSFNGTSPEFIGSTQSLWEQNVQLFCIHFVPVSLPIGFKYLKENIYLKNFKYSTFIDICFAFWTENLIVFLNSKNSVNRCFLGHNWAVLLIVLLFLLYLFMVSSQKGFCAALPLSHLTAEKNNLV